MSPCLSQLFLPFESGLCFTWHRADLPGEAGKHASCVLGFVFRPPTPRQPQASAGGDRGAGISIHGALPAQQALSWCPSSASRPPPFPGGGDTSCSSALSHHSRLPGPDSGRPGVRKREGASGGPQARGKHTAGDAQLPTQRASPGVGGTAPPPSALGGGPRLCWTSLGASTPGPPGGCGDSPSLRLQMTAR